MEKLDTLPICFIGGTGRSGTTILRKIFQQHSKVALFPEWRGTIDPDGILDFYVSMTYMWSPHLVDFKIKRLRKMLDKLGTKKSIDKVLNSVSGRLWEKSNMNLRPQYATIEVAKYCENYFEIVDELINDLSDFDFKGIWAGKEFGSQSRIYHASVYSKDQLKSIFSKFLYKFYGSIVNKQNATFYLEDNTWNFIWFDKLLDLLPNAKLVHIHRDPRDVVSSYLNQRWAPSDVKEATQFYTDLMDKWLAIRDKIPKESYFEISLYELVETPAEMLKKIGNFWGIEYEDSLLNIKLNKSNKGRWKKNLDAATAKELELNLAKYSKEYNYGI